jgi:hypothetical protein
MKFPEKKLDTTPEVVKNGFALFRSVKKWAETA